MRSSRTAARSSTERPCSGSSRSERSAAGEMFHKILIAHPAELAPPLIRAAREPGLEGGGGGGRGVPRGAGRGGSRVLPRAGGGGGGRGKRTVRGGDRRAQMSPPAWAEALAACGSGDMYAEGSAGRPRHVEIQIVA